jgi:uncharacterized phage protein (TIGR02218 family)
VKTIPAALQAHYDTGATSLAYAILIQRADGALFGFTAAAQPLTLDLSPWASASWDLAAETAFVFDARQGLDVSSIVTTSGFSVDNLELTTLDDGTLFDRDAVQAGRWRNAAFRVFRYRWDVATTIANDVETMMRGTFGEITLGENTLTVELRGIAQKLQQPIGIVSQQTCRVRFGSQGPGQCNKNPAPFIFAKTVAGVTNKQTFSATGAEPDDYYGEGIVTFTTGSNAGVSQKVRTYAGGVFTLILPMVLPVQVGDAFTAVVGCRKRLMEDCKAKFANVVNFQGEPHRPTVDDLVKPA